MRKLVKWGICLVLLVTSILIVIALPEYVAMQKDKEYVNQYQLYEQNTSDTVYADLDLEEKIELFQLSENGDGNSICVIQTAQPDEVLESNQDLFLELKKQLQQLERMQLIPVVSSYFDMDNNLEMAELYAYTSVKHPGSVLYVWGLNFIQEDGSAYFVTMDANTYKVYEFMAYGQVVNSYIEEVGDDCQEWYWQWFDDYTNYLQDEDVEKEQESEKCQTELWDVKWADAGAYGYMCTGETGWNLQLYLDVEVFSIQMSGMYEFSSSAYTE